MAQTRTVAPASGVPRELKTMSSLREPCACAGTIPQGHTCSASASNAQRNPVEVLDRVVVRSAEPASPSQIPPTILSCHAVVILKTGSRHGKYKLRVVLTTPSKK